MKTSATTSMDNSDPLRAEDDAEERENGIDPALPATTSLSPDPPEHDAVQRQHGID